MVGELFRSIEITHAELGGMICSAFIAGGALGLIGGVAIMLIARVA